MKKLNEELFINVEKGYSKELKEKFKKLLFDIGLAIISDEYLVSNNSDEQIMRKIVDYNEICNKLFVDYEGIIDRFLLIRFFIIQKHKKNLNPYIIKYTSLDLKLICNKQII